MLRRYFYPIFKLFLFCIFCLFATQTVYSIGYRIMVSAGIEGSLPYTKYILYFLSSLLTVFAFTRYDHISFKDIGIEFTEDWYANIIKGIILGTISVVIVFVILFFMGYAVPNSFETGNLIKIFGKLIGGLIVSFFFIAIGEEILMRGYLFHYLNTKFTVGGAILYTSAVYGLIYVLNPVGIGSGILFFNTFLLGVIMNLLVMKDKTLWKAIGFHFVWNFISTVLLSTPFVGVRYAGLFGISFRGTEILSGGSYGIESGLVCTIVLIGFLIYTIFKSKAKEHFAIFVKGITTRNNIIFAVTLLLFVVPTIPKDFSAWSAKIMISKNKSINKISRFKAVNNYTIKVSLDTSDKELSGKQTVDYINKSTNSLKEIYFHVYPNGYASDHKSIHFKSISSNGKKLSYNFEGKDKSLLKISLKKPLSAGKRTRINMNYIITLPSPEGNVGFYGDRFGYGKNTYNFGNFYPIAAVYKNGSWDKHIYNKKGDAFYSEVSNYEVSITAPVDYTIASSGNLKKVSENSDTAKWKAKAYGVRDFAFVSSNLLSEEEEKVDGVIVKSYAASKQKAYKALEIGMKAVKFFNSKFGKYPYSTLSIVQSDMNSISAGMEYPNLVMIGWALYNNVSVTDLINSVFTGRNKSEFEDTVVHEVAHQWWYGVVGNDEFREAWIDEPLTQYSTFLYLKHAYDKNIFDRSVSIVRIYYKGYNKSEKPNPSLDRPLDKFKNDKEYTYLIYEKGPLMFKDLNGILGDKKFYSLLKTLYDKYKYKNVTGSELINLTSDIAGKDMKPFYDKWLKTSYCK